MSYSVYLDGTLLADEPRGIVDMQRSVVYNPEYKGWFQEFDTELTFVGDGFDYLYGEITSDGVCGRVDFEVKNADGATYFDGVIFLSDIIIDEFNQVIRVSPVDNSAQAKLLNNWKVLCQVNVARSKNDDAITACTDRQIDFFNPVAAVGVYGYPNIRAFNVYDVFRFIVEFITDDEMDFDSTFFDTGGDGEGVCILKGAALSGTDANAAPATSMDDLFRNLDQVYNLSWRIDYTSSAKPVLIVEPTEDLYEDTVNVTLSDVKGLEVEFDKRELYSTVQFGSDKTQDFSGGSFALADITFLGAKEEEYHVGGECNVDNNLDLVNDYIIDSNVIEDIAVNASTNYDDDIILVETDYPGTAQATKFGNYTGATYIYNKGFNNYNKSVNWTGAIPNDILSFLNALNDGFEANESGTTPSGNIAFTNVVSDPGTHYASPDYTCGVGKDGAYSFTWSFTNVSFNYVLPPAPPIGTTISTVTMEHYDSGAVLQESRTLKVFKQADPIFIKVFTEVFNLVAGDYVRCVATNAAGYSVTYDLTTFKGDYITGDGGVYQSYDPNDQRNFKLKFRFPVSLADEVSITSNPHRLVQINTARNNWKGWPDDIRFNRSGVAELVLKTSNADLEQ